MSKSSHKIWTRGIKYANISAFYTHAHLNIGRICSHTCICSETSAGVHDAVSAHLSQATENEMFYSLPVKNQFSLTVSVWPDWNAISSLQSQRHRDCREYVRALVFNAMPVKFLKSSSGRFESRYLSKGIFQHTRRFCEHRPSRDLHNYPRSVGCHGNMWYFFSPTYTKKKKVPS